MTAYTYPEEEKQTNESLQNFPGSSEKFPPVQTALQ